MDQTIFFSLNPSENDVYHVGLNHRVDDQDYFTISVSDWLFPMYVKQDLEILLFKIRKSRDIEKMKEITFENYKLVGISELIRFCSMQVMVDRKN